MDPDPGHILFPHFDLSGVEPGAHRQPEPVEREAWTSAQRLSRGGNPASGTASDHPVPNRSNRISLHTPANLKYGADVSDIDQTASSVEKEPRLTTRSTGALSDDLIGNTVPIQSGLSRLRFHAV
jgi:hypothetical protein